MKLCPSAVVELTELAENPGLPVPAGFRVLADLITAAWFPCGHEPSWVEHWPQRALADLLLEVALPSARHLVTRTATGDLRAPLSPSRFEALADCEDARKVAERAGDRFRIYLLQFYEGQAYMMIGQPARARTVLEDSIALAKQLGTTTLLAWGQGLLATALLELGEHHAVPPLCEEAIRLAEADTPDNIEGRFIRRRDLMFLQEVQQLLQR